MGKTVPSFRIALEWEIESWNRFRRALTSSEDLEAFDSLMDTCRNNAMASGNACNPVVFHPMIMSILLSQSKEIVVLEQQLNVIYARRAGLRVVEESSS